MEEDDKEMALIDELSACFYADISSLGYVLNKVAADTAYLQALERLENIGYELQTMAINKRVRKWM